MILQCLSVMLAKVLLWIDLNGVHYSSQGTTTRESKKPHFAIQVPHTVYQYAVCFSTTTLATLSYFRLRSQFYFVSITGNRL